MKARGYRRRQSHDYLVASGAGRLYHPLYSDVKELFGIGHVIARRENLSSFPVNRVCPLLLQLLRKFAGDLTPASLSVAAAGYSAGSARGARR